MPVKKEGKKHIVNNTEYDSEAEANKAYMDYIAGAMGAPKVKSKTSKGHKTKSKTQNKDNEE